MSEWSVPVASLVIALAALSMTALAQRGNARKTELDRISRRCSDLDRMLRECEELRAVERNNNDVLTRANIELMRRLVERRGDDTAR